MQYPIIDSHFSKPEIDEPGGSHIKIATADLQT
jgi:hypothetical protein